MIQICLKMVIIKIKNFITIKKTKSTQKLIYKILIEEIIQELQPNLVKLCL